MRGAGWGTHVLQGQLAVFLGVLPNAKRNGSEHPNTHCCASCAVVATPLLSSIDDVMTPLASCGRRMRALRSCEQRVRTNLPTVSRQANSYHGQLQESRCFSNKNTTEKKKNKKKHKTMWMGGRRNETNINQFSGCPRLTHEADQRLVGSCDGS